MDGLASASTSGVQAIARRLLGERVEAITDEAVRRVAEDEPGYARSQVTVSDLRHHMNRTLTLALVRLAGDRPIDGLASAASEVGRLRAEQGLDLDALLHSFRLDLRILWAAVVNEAEGGELGIDDAHLEAFLLVWEAVEANTSDAVEAYRRARQEQERSLDVLRGLAFDRLVNHGPLDSAALRDTSRQLALPLDGRCLVVVGAGLPMDGRVTVSLATRLASRGFAGHVGWVGDELMVVACVGDGPVDPVLGILDPLARGCSAGVVVPDLSAVPVGVRLVRRAVAGVVDPGMVLVNRNWPRAIVVANHDMGTILGHEVVAPLLRLPPAERAQVLRTLATYLDSTGSIADVAAQEHCHRNTVRNRLQLVERLTGRSLHSPRDLASLTLAVEWARGPDGWTDWPAGEE